MLSRQVVVGGSGTRWTLVTLPTLSLFAALSCAPCCNVRADAIIDPYYAGGAIGQSSEEISNSERIFTAALHAHPVGGKLLIGARPRPYFGGEFELIDFGRGHFGPSSELSSASSLDLAAAGFIVGYLPLYDRQFDLFAKIGGAVYRSSYHFVDNSLDECLVNTSNGTCTPITQYPRSGSTTASGFAYGVGMQFHMGHYAIRAEFEQIISPSASEQLPGDTTRAHGLSLASLGITYGF
jgi:hypothetical protein